MKYHNITKEDMLNGDGLRVVLWVSGCEHACEGCQNPITWDPEDGLEFDDAAEKELFEALEKEYISGITFSGGDPLYPGNRTSLSALIQKIKERFPRKTIWLYTGYLWEEICDLDFIAAVDILVDGKFVKELLDNTLYWWGSSNQRVIDVQATLKQENITVPVLHCGDYDEIPMGRETSRAPKATDENIVQFNGGMDIACCGCEA